MLSFTRFGSSLQNQDRRTGSGMQKRLVFFSNISILLILIYLPAQVFAQPVRYEFARGLMGSQFRLILYAPDSTTAHQAANRAFERIEALNEILSDYRDGSEINRLSARSGTGEWVAVSPELFDILSISKKISRQTGGTFDVTVGPVVQLWRRAMRRQYFPEKEAIQKARRSVGYRYIELDPGERKVRLKRKGMRLDVGGIGKGYAADEAVRVLRERGITSVLLDAGGDLTLGDPPPGEPGWKVEISSGIKADSVLTLELANTGIATSGASYRFLEHQGQRYSHIVDPHTGVGLRYHVRTTVLAPTGTLADALATALSVAGIRRGKRLLKQFPEVQVWLLETKGRSVRSWNTLSPLAP
ncbi:FAD:protein FMN transferase [Telluribacter sp.]|jgi:thiamine biosynthesis lipoprotein|uniref:FAD:protein FMN transferase n=1 Tax=Telluribacter sp. TaxID=1978767 RepID=UPI002E137BBB|nr:FAD:protein FMN transferase [Telluribacter sp.]